MRRRTLRVAVLAGALSLLPVQGVVADTRINTSNESIDSHANSGDATATNTANAENSSTTRRVDATGAAGSSVTGGTQSTTNDQASDASSGSSILGQVVTAEVVGDSDVVTANTVDGGGSLSGQGQADNFFVGGHLVRNAETVIQV